MKSRYCLLLFVLCAATTVAGRGLAAVARAQPRQHSTETGLYRTWPAGGPKVLWKTTVAEGYAGAAIKAGRLYVNDYDPEKKEHVVRCLSMADGKEVWRWSYAVDIRPNHGITQDRALGRRRRSSSRSTRSAGSTRSTSRPASSSGRRTWCRTTRRRSPGWYAGQNPLLDGDRIILATGGDALAVAFDQATGKEIWRSPNPGKDLMSHTSLMPATIGGVKQYLYLTLNKVVGVAAADGQILWSIPFATKMAAVPSPISIGDGRVFITSGYEAGSMMFQVDKGASGFTAHKLYDLTERAVQLRGAHADPLQEPPVRGRIEDARPLHVRRPRRQGGLAEPGRVGRRGGVADVRPRRLPAGRRHVLRRSTGRPGCCASSRRAPPGTRSWPARRSCRARRCGARSRCRTAGSSSAT